MPFFRCGNKKICSEKNAKKNCSVTLQVRNPLWKWIKTAGKRASFSASPKLAGSMTAEAAVCFPLFLFFMVLMTAPVTIMDTRGQVQARLEEEGEKIARRAYLTTGLAQTEETDILAGLSERAVCLMVENALRSDEKTGRASGFSAAGSRIMEDGETIDLVVNYKIKLPFPVFFLSEVPQQVRCIRRAWTGRDGLGAETGGGWGDGDEIVYMGRDGSRYHRSRTCHYLYNELTAVSLEEIEGRRSQSGNRYRPCSVCGGSGSGVVYIMPSGERYHSRKDCSSIAAYVRAVPLKSVEHLGACSYCSR